MAASNRAISISFDNAMGDVDTMLLPRTQHAEDFTPNYSREDQDDYTYFKGLLTYTATEGAWSGQDARVTFRGYYDTPGDLWTNKFTFEAENGGHVTVAASKGNAILLHFALEYTQDQINLLGAKITGNRSDNVLTGGLVHDTLKGMAGNDTLNGRSGDDLIVGGAGRDDLTGGLGTDTFYFAKISESGARGSARDIIRDMAYNDVIDLSAIDAAEDRRGNNKFKWIDGASFTGHEGELRYSKSGVLSADIDGDKHADFSINIANHYDLQSDNFIL